MNFDSENVVGNILGDKKVKQKRQPQQKPLIRDPETRKNVNYGVGGAVVGALVGAPFLGAAVGLAAANKEKIKKSAKKFDNQWGKR